MQRFSALRFHGKSGYRGAAPVEIERTDLYEFLQAEEPLHFAQQGA